MRNTLAVSALALLLTGCSDDICGVPNSISDRNEVNVTGISTIAVSRELSDGSLESLENSAEVSIDELHIRVELDYTTALREARSKQWNPLGWVIGTANACSLKSYEGDIETQVVSANLVSSAALDDRFPAGASLDTVFGLTKVRVAGVDYGGPFWPDKFDEYYESSYATSETIASIAEYPGEEDRTSALIYDLRPLEGDVFLSPPQASAHQFTFTLTLESGEVFTQTSDQVLVSNREQ